jgi:hypothetical protein
VLDFVLSARQKWPDFVLSTRQKSNLELKIHLMTAFVNFESSRFVYLKSINANIITIKSQAI